MNKYGTKLSSEGMARMLENFSEVSWNWPPKEDKTERQKKEADNSRILKRVY